MSKQTVKYATFFIMAPLSLIIIAMFVARNRQTETLSASQKFAMEALPGYFFVFEGETNHIVQARNHRTFLNQHPMMPYLELIVADLEERPWAKNFAIRVRETDSHVIISLPSWAERLGMTGPTVFHSGYSLEVTIDKKTMSIVSAYQG